MLVLSDPALAIGCLDSLAAASRIHEVETVVIANGMPAEACAVLEGREDIVLVRSGTNLGFAGGNNLAAEIARGRYLLLLNDDSTLEEGYIDRLLATAERDPSIGAVGGRIISADGSLQEAGSVLWKDGWAAHVGLGLPAGSKAFTYVRDVDYTSANGLLVRREGWDAVGGLDESYFPAYYEDVDFCMSLRQHGFRVVYEPRARLCHLESQSTSSRYRNFLLIRNRQHFVEKWSAELARFDDRLGAPDARSINRAIHLASGSPPRLLVDVGDGSSASNGAIWDVVEALARIGWAVTVTVAAPTPEAEPGWHQGGPTTSDGLTELGVDLVEGDIEVLFAEVGTDFEAVVIGGTSSWKLPPIVRDDGTQVPVLNAPLEGQEGDVALAVMAVTSAARRTPNPRSPSNGGWYSSAMADGAGIGLTLSGGETQAPINQPAVKQQSGVELTAQAHRELRFAKIEVGVKDEYVAALEAEIRAKDEQIVMLRGAFDEVTDMLKAKISYIDSLPSVRLKLWLLSLQGKSKS